jgi:hypothetical protein
MTNDSKNKFIFFRGDRFARVVNPNEVYMLCQTGKESWHLIDLGNGNRYHDPEKNIKAIYSNEEGQYLTLSDMEVLIGDKNFFNQFKSL